MIDVEALEARWNAGRLKPLAACVAERIAAGMSAQRYGDLPRWQEALESLPPLVTRTTTLDQSVVRVTGDAGEALAQLTGALNALHPWRKGPFDLFGVHIDTEWRSDWKWARLEAQITSLEGRCVLDVGCGNGYHCWRIRGGGASEVIGIDPSPLFVLQFQALQHYINDPAVTVLPMGIESMPPAMHAFDTVFSMGVLYHRRSPMKHLRELQECLRPGGELVLETLVIEGDERSCLVPTGRYARMGNVWFIPSAAMLVLWLEKLGWKNVRLIDETVTSTEEQRATDWMTFHSLADFLDPDDPSLTTEGYPAPRRAILIADAPGG